MSFTTGQTTRWTSPELLDPEQFGLTDSRPTKQSDCYALGMVVYEVCVRTILVFTVVKLITTGSLWKSSLLENNKGHSGNNVHFGR